MKRYWTQDRVLEGLKEAMAEIRGKLPCDDKSYNRIKAYRYHWPPIGRILEYYHSVARAWLAAGAPKHKVSLRNIKWTKQEDNFLLENAGTLRLKDIATRLCRSYSATRSRLNRYYGLKAKENQGFVSAASLSKIYKCPYSRICKYLNSGVIEGVYDPVRHSWRIDLINITPEVIRMLNEPKATHKSGPADHGDYEKRHGLSRQIVDGKVKRVKERRKSWK